ncbi:hypothetical protein R9C00_21705 [Flammeovirgaceae bacterium SG7u.111]|nr:hypothetical protein [Flammeovirgaceae bacterium SG7u.132]WPO34318.1 hypothetical protein R9C00_21705 [Flammeovirgaceae bacterium SG7u.111]
MKLKYILFAVLLPIVGCSLFEKDEEKEEIILPETLTLVKDRIGNTYEVGYDQVSNTNQDPYVQKTDAAGNVSWRVAHAISGLREQATLVNLDPEDNPWVVFSVNGSDSTDASFQKRYSQTHAFDSVLFSDYGYGGGAEVSILAKLNRENGQIEKATFLIARTKEGSIFSPFETNSFRVNAFGVGYEKVVVEAQSWYRPPSAESTEDNFVFHPAAVNEHAIGSYWEMSLVMPLNLSELQEIELTKADLVE